MRSAAEPAPDPARIVVEYRDAANATVLDVFDSGDIVDVKGWHRLTDLKLASAGTRFIRVQLITARWGGDNADGYFDGLTVRSACRSSTSASTATATG
ncbi:MAG: hypothetical protein GY708_29200 [Actinomycetia bacterium]|nr:hypothetical protein [Actinomycetes bacterium]